MLLHKADSNKVPEDIQNRFFAKCSVLSKHNTGSSLELE